MTTRRFLQLSALAAFVLLGLQYTAIGQGVTQRLFWLADGAGNAIASTNASSVRGLNVYIKNPADGSSVTYTAEDHNLGAATSTTLRTAPVSSGATGAAPTAAVSYLGFNSSGATGGFLAGAIGCDQQAFLNMATATTTQIVALTSGRKIHVCYWLALANGTTTFTWKRGTGSNCGTGTTSISPDWNLAAQVGFSGGTGAFPIFDNQNAGDALCGTSSAAVNLQLYIRYAVL